MNRYEDALERAQVKFKGSIRPAADAGIIPYKSENGKWLESPYDGNSWWTGGFWPGIMWLLYARGGGEAERRELGLVAHLGEKDETEGTQEKREHGKDACWNPKEDDRSTV